MKKFVFIAVLLPLGGICFAQNPLPVIKASSRFVDIRDGNHFKTRFWYILPEKNLDHYYVEIPEKAHTVTFATDLDSISFYTAFGKHYDFIILLNGKDSCRTRISANYKNLKSYVRKKVTPGSDTLSFTLGDNDKVYLKGTVNGSQSLNLQFDLGAGGTLVKKSSVKQVKFNFDTTITLHNSDGVNNVPSASNNHLEIGNLAWDSVAIDVADNMTHREDLVVGNSLFKNKVLEVNYDKRIFVIHDTVPHLDAGYSQHDIILDGGTVPFIEGSLTFRDKTQKGWMMVDLGAYTSILNNKDVPVTNKMLGEAKKMLWLDNTSSSLTLRISKYEFSEFNYVSQKLNGDGLQLILGNDLLKRFNLVLDNRNGLLYLKPNSLTQASYRNPEYFAVRVAAGLLILLAGFFVLWKKRKNRRNKSPNR